MSKLQNKMRSAKLEIELITQLDSNPVSSETYISQIKTQTEQLHTVSTLNHDEQTASPINLPTLLSTPSRDNEIFILPRPPPPPLLPLTPPHIIASFSRLVRPSAHI